MIRYIRYSVITSYESILLTIEVKVQRIVTDALNSTMQKILTIFNNINKLYLNIVILHGAMLDHILNVLILNRMMSDHKVV